MRHIESHRSHTPPPGSAFTELSSRLGVVASGPMKDLYRNWNAHLKASRQIKEGQPANTLSCHKDGKFLAYVYMLQARDENAQACKFVM